MAGADGPVVVKLGGSFAFSAHLRNWIEALASCAGCVVIVPGGGPFADAVRSAQSRMGFDDRAAHHMAVLAMEQYGRALVSLNSLLLPAESADAIRRDLSAGRIPVWMPARMVLDAADIAPSWDASSDSLAAWLAGKIGASRVFLVKHIEFRSGQARSGSDELAAMGVVDKAFARHLRTSAVAASIFGPADYSAAIAAIRDGAAAGVPVE
jgi:5-(aminomethyl)-3-furanmethanol phosphate kinase